MKDFPAFPHSFTTIDGEDQYGSGMTMRDWYAGLAMQVLIMRSNDELDPELMTKNAFAIADAMLDQVKP